MSALASSSRFFFRENANIFSGAKCSEKMALFKAASRSVVNPRNIRERNEIQAKFSTSKQDGRKHMKVTE
jgi:hypothetical protein